MAHSVSDDNDMGAHVAHNEVGRESLMRSRSAGASTQLLPGASVAAFLLLSSSALAGPPYFTDDPEPVDYQHFELYEFSQGTHVKGETNGVAPSCDCNYGILPNVQLHIQTGMALHRADGVPLLWGPGDTEFGVKYRFIEQDKKSWVPSVAFYPLLEAPTGDAARALGAGRTRAFLPLWVQKDVGDWTTFGGGGYWINPGPGNKNHWFVGWVLQRKITDKLALGVELFHQTPSEIGGMQSTGFNVGGIYDLTDHYHFLFSFGKGLQHAKETNEFSWYVGLQVTGGGEQPKSQEATPSSRSAPPFAWTGFYVGAAVGHAWQKVHEADLVDYVPAPFSSYAPKGAVFGGLAGINYQLGSLVAGVETDVEAGGVKGRQESSLIEMHLQNDVRASLRGRAGIATERTLLYVTGGAALANFFANALWEPFSQARPGWTLGAGVEYAVTDQWSAQLEYRHSDFGAATFPSDNFDGNFYHLRMTDNSARVAVAYRFDFSEPEPVGAKY